MIRWNNAWQAIIIFILVGNIQLHAQHLYGLEHSLKFADYLYASGQYDLAAEEYERAVFLDPDNVHAKLQLIKSYKRNENFQEGINRVLSFHDNDITNIDQPFSSPFIQMNLRLRNYPQVSNFLKRNQNLSGELKINTSLSMALLEGRWEHAQEMVTGNPEQVNVDLLKITEKSLGISYKRPWLGITMSMLLPGSGKVYAGRWKDGLVSFIFVATSAWQAYRGFDKYGAGSAYGWIFGSVSLGFYTGNVYGAHKAVKQYNNKLDENLQHKAEHIIFSDF